MRAMRYDIRFECATSSGQMSFYAVNGVDALRQFDDAWEWDAVPSRWIVASWILS